MSLSLLNFDLKQKSRHKPIWIFLDTIYGVCYLTKFFFGKKVSDLFLDKLIKNFNKLRLIANLPDGQKAFIRFNDRCIIFDIYEDKCYDYFPIKEGSTIVDVGAHIGIFSLKVSKDVGKGGKVIAVEPFPENYELLIKNLAINDVKNVIPINVAVTKKSRKVKLYIDNSSATGTHSIFKGGLSAEKYIVVKSIGLRELLEKFKIRNVNLLKIDAEGAELEILEGMGKELKNVENIVMEVHPGVIDHRRLEKCLIENGFKIAGKRIYPTMVYLVYAHKSR